MWRQPLRWLLIAAGAAGAAAALYLLMLRPAGPHPYEWNGRTINPAAPIERSRTYPLRLWETDIPIPKQAGAYRAVLHGALAEFADRYPNAHVEVEFISEDSLWERLAAAVGSGDPPDVVALPEPVSGLRGQVPVDPYLPSPRVDADDEQPLYFRAAIHPWTSEGKTWAFPRWISWEVWGGHKRRLEAAGIDVEGTVRYGWTWNDAQEVAQRLRERGVSGAFALDVLHPVLYWQLMANAGAPWWQAAEGPLWSPEVLEEVARFLLDLENQRALGRRPVPQIIDRVTRFADNGAIIAPVNPWLYRYLHERHGEDIVLLPVPHGGVHPEVPPLVPSGYAVFARADYPGDDHLRLAMELAQFLSRRPALWTAQHAGFLPTGPRDIHGWQEQSVLDEQARTFLLDYLAHYPDPGPPAVMASYLPPPSVRNRLAAAASQLFQTSRPDPSRWAQDTARSLRESAPQMLPGASAP